MSFLLTGSEYISWWLYGLPRFFESTAVDLLSGGVGYLFQAAGILAFALLVRKRPELALNRRLFASLVVMDVAMTAAVMLSAGAFPVLLFGLIMNLLHGAIAAYYLTRLAQYVPQQSRGMTFALGYAFGSVGSWAMSLPIGGAFLGTPYVLIAYAVMAFVIIFISFRLLPDIPDEYKPADAFSFSKSVIPLAGLVVVLLSVIKGLGFYFPVSDSAGGAVSAEFTRAFYAVGLILAGYVNDRNRKHGAICCLCALVFPFITFALLGKPSVELVLWITGYVFFGFFSVYRVVTFADFAGKNKSLLPVAGLGLLFGRVGDGVSAIGGIAVGEEYGVLLAVFAVLFVVTILCFFKFYNKTYAAPLPQKENAEALLCTFEKRFELSARETEVFRLIVNGRSNSEIAADLYIADSTVKFHVKNVLKKTSCANRTELIARYQAGQIL